MRVNGLMKFIAGTAVAATVGLATAAQAAADVDIPGTGFAGVAGNGNTGTDAFGQTWRWGFTSGDGINPAGDSVWGVPGLGFGTVKGYNGSVPATDFFVSFLTSASNTFINMTPSPIPYGYDEETRFSVCTSLAASSCVAWTPVYQPTVNPLEVNFFAPAGSSLKKGDYYFVNVVFTNGALSGSNAGFSAIFSTTVPEASTWAMMIVGIAGIGGAMRSTRRKQAASLIGC